MNYYDARQREDGSGWHYIKLNKRSGTRPVGYCADHPPHATEAEARECYRQYELDNAREGKLSDQMLKCRVCGEYTEGFMEVGHTQMVVLCDVHRTREQLDKLIDPPGMICSSW